MTGFPTVAVVGAPGCGKTSLARGARGLPFRADYHDPTIEDVTLEFMQHGSVSYTLWVADLGGFRHMYCDADSPYAIVSQYLEGAAGAFIVVVDATDSISHQVAVSVLLWLSTSRPGVPAVVVVTKCDLVTDAPDHRWFATTFPSVVRATWAVSSLRDTSVMLAQPFIWAAASLQKSSPASSAVSVSQSERPLSAPISRRSSMLKRSVSLNRISTITSRK